MLDTLYKRLAKLVKEEVAKRRAESAQRLRHCEEQSDEAIQNLSRHCEPVRAWQSISILISENLKIVIKEITGLLHYACNDNCWARLRTTGEGFKAGLLCRFTPANDEKLRKKIAFTLAEILITITIVGVVAAMTLPILSHKINQYILKSQATKMYASINHAMRLLYTEDNFIFTCYYNGGSTLCYDFFDKLAKKMKIAKYCSNNGYTKGCLPNYVYENRPNSWGCDRFNYEVIKTSAPSYVFMDGTILIPYYIGGREKTMPLFLVDVNGKKGPNKPGYDLFEIILSTPQGDIPTMISAMSCLKPAPGGKSITQIIK